MQAEQSILIAFRIHTTLTCIPLPRVSCHLLYDPEENIIAKRMTCLLLHKGEACGAVICAKHVCLKLLGDLGKVRVVDACHIREDPPARLKLTLATNDGPVAYVSRDQRGVGCTAVDWSAEAVYTFQIRSHPVQTVYKMTP